MVSDAKLKRFEARIKQLKDRKINEICEKYPVTNFDPIDCVMKGRGNLKPSAIIREYIKGQRSKSSYINIYIEDIFDLTSEKSKIEILNSNNYTVREQKKSVLIEDVNVLLDEAAFGDEKALLYAIKSFEVKSYV
jgi:hypothetical protein